MHTLKWIEAVPTNSMTAVTTIRVMRRIFATHGVPRVVVSDNGPCFIAQDFESFLKINGVKHSLSASYHPATNGLAEGAVQTNIGCFCLPFRLAASSETCFFPKSLTKLQGETLGKNNIFQ